MRIAICTNFMSPYRRPVFESLARTLDAEVRVMTCTGMEGDRNWAEYDGELQVTQSFCLTRTRRVRFDGPQPYEQRLERHFPIGLPIDLMKFNPDAIITGEMGPRTLTALATGAMCGIPVIPWTYHAEAQASGLTQTAGIRRSVLRSAPAVIGMGSQARRVLRWVGCADENIFDAPNAADYVAVRDRMLTIEHKHRFHAIRYQYGKRIALVVGRLIPMKGIESLLETWKSLDAATRSAWSLVFVGDGPLRGMIEEHASHGVHCVGHVEPTELADWYVASDLHVFASLGDPWGLVVNEAMQCGTPTLCSRLAGCSDDLIEHGVNGFLFDPSASRAEVARSLLAALRHPQLRVLGWNARNDATAITPEAMARGMADAVLHAVRNGPQRHRKAS